MAPPWHGRLERRSHRARERGGCLPAGPQEGEPGPLRLAVLRPADGTIVTLGEHQSFSAEAQQLTSQRARSGTSVPTARCRLTTHFFRWVAYAAAVLVVGHRNPQAAAIHPSTGELWVTEHGPQGGDEVNLALAGRDSAGPRSRMAAITALRSRITFESAAARAARPSPPVALVPDLHRAGRYHVLHR